MQHFSCRILAFFLGFSLHPVVAVHAQEQEYKERVVFAKVVSCASCKLKDEPDVRNFIFEDLESYQMTSFIKIPGKDPMLFLITDMNNTFRAIPMLGKSRRELNEIMEEYKFVKKPGYEECAAVNLEEYRIRQAEQEELLKADVVLEPKTEL